MRRRSRGIAIILAMAVMAAAGTALALMSSQFAADARRTREATAEAQLRELLHAGAAAARAGAADGEMQTPVEGAVVEIRREGERVMVRVKVGERERRAWVEIRKTENQNSEK